MAAYQSFSCRSGIKQRKEKKNQLSPHSTQVSFSENHVKPHYQPIFISCNRNRILCDRDAMSTEHHVQSTPKDDGRSRTPNQHPSIRNLEAAALEVNYKFDLHTLGLLQTRKRVGLSQEGLWYRFQGLFPSRRTFPSTSILRVICLHALRRGGSLSIHPTVRDTRGPATWKRN